MRSGLLDSKGASESIFNVNSNRRYLILKKYPRFLVWSETDTRPTPNLVLRPANRLFASRAPTLLTQTTSTKAIFLEQYVM